LAGLAILALAGCTTAQVNQVQADIQTAQTSIQIADEALNSFNAVVQAAAPGSKLAAQTKQATITATKVNGVVQHITIAIPVTPETTLGQ
jgi:hypothetical protein